ncbi:hypothetical protein ACGFJT_34730 [Actinomadura geliboluensis]|uniref:hypothetical protein n=1 Tax=Actinomadura geliboluensis TaxID=882440 RepID=UPI00371FB21A
MFDAETTAILTGAAANVVAYMLNGRVDALRSWIGRVFHSASEQERSNQLRAVEDDLAALTGHVYTEADVKARWAVILASHLAAHPEALAEIQAMGAPATARSMHVEEQHNYGSGTFIGGDNYGWINPASNGDA